MCFKAAIIEITEEEATKLIKESKGNKIPVSICNLEENCVESFLPIFKETCIDMSKQAETVARRCDELVQTIDAYSTKQNIKKIQREGKVSTFLLVPRNNEEEKIE